MVSDVVGAASEPLLADMVSLKSRISIPFFHCLTLMTFYTVMNGTLSKHIKLHSKLQRTVSATILELPFTECAAPSAWLTVISQHAIPTHTHVRAQ